MTMSINDLAYDYGDDTYYSAGFHDFFMSYYMYFMDPVNQLLSTITVEPGIALKYSGDFIGLLNYLNVPPEYHWCTMIVNGLKSVSEMNMNMINILLPDINELETLKNLYESTD